MITINNVDDKTFTFNGITYYKNFTPIVRGQNIQVLNTYDSKISLTEFPVIFSDFIIDGATPASVVDAQNLLLPILFTRSSLNSDVNISDLISTDPSNIIELGTDGKLFAESSGGVIPRISTGYAKATDFGNINFYPKALFSDIPIQNNANNDTWLAVTFVNQRVIHHFGEAVSLDKITYVNGTRSVDGSSETFGAKDIVIYAITADVDPVFTYGTTDANYTQIFSGTLDQYTIAQSKTPPEITLTNVPANTFALVYDIANNYAASARIEIRRLTAYKN